MNLIRERSSNANKGRKWTQEMKDRFIEEQKPTLEAQNIV